MKQCREGLRGPRAHIPEANNVRPCDRGRGCPMVKLQNSEVYFHPSCMVRARAPPETVTPHFGWPVMTLTLEVHNGLQLLSESRLSPRTPHQALRASLFPSKTSRKNSRKNAPPGLPPSPFPKLAPLMSPGISVQRHLCPHLSPHLEPWAPHLPSGNTLPFSAMATHEPSPLPLGPLLHPPEKAPPSPSTWGPIVQLLKGPSWAFCCHLHVGDAQICTFSPGFSLALQTQLLHNQPDTCV